MSDLNDRRFRPSSSKRAGSVLSLSGTPEQQRDTLTRAGGSWSDINNGINRTDEYDPERATLEPMVIDSSSSLSSILAWSRVRAVFTPSESTGQADKKRKPKAQLSAVFHGFDGFLLDGVERFCESSRKLRLLMFLGLAVFVVL